MQRKPMWLVEVSVSQWQAVNTRNRSFVIGALVDLPAPGVQGACCSFDDGDISMLHYTGGRTRGDRSQHQERLGNRLRRPGDMIPVVPPRDFEPCFSPDRQAQQERQRL
jgi:hypothetical protein